MKKINIIVGAFILTFIGVVFPSPTDTLKVKKEIDLDKEKVIVNKKIITKPDTFIIQQKILFQQYDEQNIKLDSLIKKKKNPKK